MSRVTPYLMKRVLLDLYKLPSFALAKHFKSLWPHIPARPLSATICITKNCNSRCITCKQWREESHNELTTEEAIGLMAQLRELGVISVGFAGGEPLLRADLAELVKAAKNLGFSRVSIGTNGLALTRKKAQELIENGLTDIGISLEGDRDVHDHCRGIKGSYEKTMSALRMTVELRDAGFKHLNISVLTILMEPTLDQITGMVEICRQLKTRFSMALIDTSPYVFENADEASSLAINDQKRLNELIDQLHRLKKESPGVIMTSHAALEFARRYFKDPKREDLACLLGYINLYIDSYGNVYSGCYTLGSLGNVRERKVKEIIRSNEFRHQLQQMALKKCPGCSCNYPTNLAYHLPSLWAEIKWKFRGSPPGSPR